MSCEILGWPISGPGHSEVERGDFTLSANTINPLNISPPLCSRLQSEWKKRIHHLWEGWSTQLELVEDSIHPYPVYRDCADS